MIVTIDKKEISAVKYACSLCDHKANFFTIESNDKMVQVEILNEDSKEPTLTMVWHLARQVETKLACEAFAKR